MHSVTEKTFAHLSSSGFLVYCLQCLLLVKDVDTHFIDMIVGSYLNYSWNCHFGSHNIKTCQFMLFYLFSPLSEFPPESTEIASFILKYFLCISLFCGEASTLMDVCSDFLNQFWFCLMSHRWTPWTGTVLTAKIWSSPLNSTLVCGNSVIIISIICYFWHVGRHEHW